MPVYGSWLEDETVQINSRPCGFVIWDYEILKNRVLRIRTKWSVEGNTNLAKPLCHLSDGIYDSSKINKGLEPLENFNYPGKSFSGNQ